VAQTKRHQRRLLRATLHAIDAVLRPLDSSDSAMRKEPTSVKKLQQGDAYWSTQKRILGWELDTSGRHSVVTASPLRTLVHSSRHGPAATQTTSPCGLACHSGRSSGPWPPASRVRGVCSPFCKKLSAGGTNTACG
jgi:hypothetical protein